MGNLVLSSGAGDVFYGFDGAANHRFYTAGTAALIITNSGNVGIGTTNPTAPLTVNGSLQVTGGSFPTGAAGFEATYTSNTSFLQSYDRTNSVWKAMNINASTVTTTNQSDVRLKRDVASLNSTQGLASILSLRPVTYRWRDEQRNHEQGPPSRNDCAGS